MLGVRRLTLGMFRQLFRSQARRVSQTCAANMDLTSQQIQQDWENREFIEILSESIKNIAKFLNNFGEWFDASGDRSLRKRSSDISSKF